MKHLLPLYAALLCACPPFRAIRVEVAPRRPGEPLALRARLILNVEHRVAGRLHLALRLPDGWRVSGSYRLGPRTFKLFPAEVVSHLYRKRWPRRGHSWKAFVSHLHTGLERGATLSAEVELLPPPAWTDPEEIEVRGGIAPSYRAWTKLGRWQRRLIVRP